MEQFTSSYGGGAESISICSNKAECDIAKIMSDIKEVQPNFIFEILNDNPAEPVTAIRCNIESESDAIDFLKTLEEVSCTQWIVKGEIKNPQRVVHHKYWVCQHSKRNKKTLEQTPRNTCCEAKLDILIKKCNRNTSRNDPYLRQKPPLCGKICITNTHNHPINTSGALKYLRITPETQENFIQYFEDGMGCSEAHRLHESILLNKNNSLELLANGAINPTRNCLSHLYKTWRDKAFGSLMAPLEKVKEEESHLVKDTINAEFRRLENLSDSVPIAIRKKFVKKLKTINNAQQLTSFMVKCNHISSVGKSRGKIKVQPTSISRRRPGLTRGSGRVPSGRPAKARRVNRVKKRPHSLSSNVSKNQMNAIYHG